MSNKRFSHLKPVNRHLLIIPHYKKSESTTSGVLLPEDFREDSPQFIEATVLDIATDCNKEFKHLSYRSIRSPKDGRILVDSAMISEIKLKDKKYYMILENYVIGIFKSIGE